MSSTIVNNRVLDAAPDGFLSSFIADGVKNFLFLDFDGVFNPYSVSGTFKKDFFNPDSSDYFREISKDPRTGLDKKKSYEIRWSKELISSFDELFSSDDTQVIWLSTWRNRSGWFVDNLSFKENRTHLFLPWEADFLSRDPQSGKIHGLSRIFDDVSDVTLNGVKIAWADDQIVPIYKSDVSRGGKGISRLLNDDNFLAVAPDSHYGLSRDQVSDILSFFR